jgi:hypothetical protein
MTGVPTFDLRTEADRWLVSMDGWVLRPRVSEGWHLLWRDGWSACSESGYALARLLGRRAFESNCRDAMVASRLAAKILRRIVSIMREVVLSDSAADGAHVRRLRRLVRRMEQALSMLWEYEHLHRPGTQL